MSDQTPFYQIKLPLVRSDNRSDKLPQFKPIDFDKFLEHFQEIKKSAKERKDNLQVSYMHYANYLAPGTPLRKPFHQNI